MTDSGKDDGGGATRKPASSEVEPTERELHFLWGWVTATIIGISSPFLLLFYSPIAMVLVVAIGVLNQDRRNPRSFADGLLIGGVVWFLLNGLCSALIFNSLDQQYG